MTTITSHHTNACFRAWIKCENLLNELYSFKDFFSRKVVKVIDECAFVCMGTFNALKCGTADIRNMAVLCVGICEECADICSSHGGEAFQSCAKTCRECSDTLNRGLI